MLTGHMRDVNATPHRRPLGLLDLAAEQELALLGATLLREERLRAQHGGGACTREAQSERERGAEPPARPAGLVSPSHHTTRGRMHRARGVEAAPWPLGASKEMVITSLSEVEFAG